MAETLLVQIVGDAKQYMQEMQKSEQATQKFSKTATQGTKSASQGFLNLDKSLEKPVKGMRELGSSVGHLTGQLGLGNTALGSIIGQLGTLGPVAAGVTAAFEVLKVGITSIISYLNNMRASIDAVTYSASMMSSQLETALAGSSKEADLLYKKVFDWAKKEPELKGAISQIVEEDRLSSENVKNLMDTYVKSISSGKVIGEAALQIAKGPFGAIEKAFGGDKDIESRIRELEQLYELVKASEEYQSKLSGKEQQSRIVQELAEKGTGGIGTEVGGTKVGGAQGGKGIGERIALPWDMATDQEFWGKQWADQWIVETDRVAKATEDAAAREAKAYEEAAKKIKELHEQMIEAQQEFASATNEIFEAILGDALQGLWDDTFGTLKMQLDESMGVGEKFFKRMINSIIDMMGQLAIQALAWGAIITTLNAIAPGAGTAFANLMGGAAGAGGLLGTFGQMGQAVKTIRGFDEPLSDAWLKRQGRDMYKYFSRGMEEARPLSAPSTAFNQQPVYVVLEGGLDAFVGGVRGAEPMVKRRFAREVLRETSRESNRSIG